MISFSDYGTHDESAYPELWEGCIGAWAPCLGPTGLRLHDFSRNQNWGTLTNMDAATDWVVDGGQYAIDLDGTNDYVTVADTVTLEPVTGVSICAWANPRVVPQNLFATIAAKEFSLPRSNPFISYKLGGYSESPLGRYSFEVNVNSVLTILAGTVGPVAGVPVFLCGTYDGLVMRLYINGSFNSSRNAAGSIAYGNSPFLIGANAAGAELWNGTVDDVRVYNRPLSPNEIKTLSLGRGIAYTPRRRKAYYFGPTFQPAWARGSNVLLQPCGVA